MKSKYTEFIKENFFEWDSENKQILFYYWVKRYKKYGVAIRKVGTHVNPITCYGISGKIVLNKTLYNWNADELYYYKSGDHFYPINNSVNLFSARSSWTYLSAILNVFLANEELYENCLKLKIDPINFVIREESSSPIKAYQASIKTLKYCYKYCICEPFFIEFVKKHRKRIPSDFKSAYIPDETISMLMQNEKHFEKIMNFMKLLWWQTYRCEWKELIQAKIITKKTFPEFPQTNKAIKRLEKFYEEHEDLLEEIKTKALQKDYDNFYTDKLDYSTKKYTIFMCKNLKDLVTEGSELSHCVARFSTSLAKGNEQILFFRTIEHPETPFYTINVKDDKIRQIHGKFNRNLPKKYYPFVKKWAKLNNLEFDPNQFNKKFAEV